ncbi:hypothetical protein Goklo_012570 [Gossypium klotzschianum]|uniref:Uncharacterized protein n=1 Tax=Gossypium klotzschianum TaxID=34286 RepID=A0A7J8VDC8_9ROSI|nr:hypothetical protein [Gossypium klotzschianum]
MAKKLKSIMQELLKDEETCNPELLNDENLTNLNQIKEMLEFRKNVSIASKFGQGNHFHLELVKVVSIEIQKASDQGLSTEDVYSLVRCQEKGDPKLALLHFKNLEEIKRFTIL